ncbi:DUF4040 family protein [Corynebacterium sp. CCM 9185]|uniref:DUF4040 family protein n=1 Tax=Corynebacterium marambiense TaxID=2765364 RepID=A0ABS0VS84_9CORY|nr:DUF4040 family protein [Corynebacterium marambiense]MCK7662474.1 DUF4040 family protein [Corynebacterium marambiense]
MTLFIVLALAALALGLAPFTVRLFDRRAGWPLAAIFLIAAGLLARHIPRLLDGEVITYRHVWARDFLSPGHDADFALRGDPLSVFFALLALVIGAVVFIYSASYLHNKQSNGSFYVIMSAFMLAVLLLVLSDDVVLMFIAWELVSIGSFLLIARAGSGGEAGSVRTLILTFTGGLTLLAALTIAATQAGTTDLTDILASDFWTDDPRLGTAVGVLIAISAFTKSAQFPFHFWLPEAMAAATPVSAFLHAAAVVKAGIYLLLRFSTVMHDNHVWNLLLITVGMFTAVMASLFAIQKTDLKRLTAYSTVSHLGWIVATIGIGTPFALAAAVLHTLTHALFKSSLFMLIGVVDHEAGSRDVRRLGPLWNRMPFTFTGVLVGSLSMAAVPPLMGFISKESMLEAFTEAPLDTAGVWLLLGAAGVGAVFTFTYSARLVLGAFVDGPRDMSEVHEAPVQLWLPAALPGLVSLPLAFVAASLDEPLDAVVGSITTAPHLHLGLWHGVTVPLGISVVVLIVGVLGVLARKRILPAFDGRSLLPFTGNIALRRFIELCGRWGRTAGRMADSYSPSRHLLYPLLVLIVFATVVLFMPGIDGVTPEPRIEGIDDPIDLIPLLIIVVSVFGLARARTRLSGAVLLGTTGVGVTLQILALGAPDVALTQFLVETLVVVIIMMVIRQQPEEFHKTSARRRTSSAILGVATGTAAFAAVMGLLGRHERSDIALYYLNNGPEITGGDNIVNTILVEFRAFDTLGELAVLGMAGVVISAVVGSVPRHPFRRGTRPLFLPESIRNALPLEQLQRYLVPVLGVLSFLIFMRGHNSPGGGFIAALVAGGAIMSVYLACGTDKPVVRPNTPFLLTGIGVLTAIGSGFLGFLEGSFLYPLHGHIGPEHVSTSMIFDVGVFLAVLGMLTLAINALGGYLRPGADKKLLPFHRGGEHPLPTTPDVRSDPKLDDPRQPETSATAASAAFSAARATDRDPAPAGDTGGGTDGQKGEKQ